MTKDQRNGKLKHAKGTAKKAWAELTHDPELGDEGTADQLEGAVQDKAGDAKEVVEDTGKAIKKGIKKAAGSYEMGSVAHRDLAPS